MRDKFKDERFIKKILLVFLAIQPFLDCYLLYTDSVINLFHFSPTTIIRFLIVGILFLMVFLNRNIAGNRKPIFIYGGVILIYFILHHFTVYNYNVDALPTFVYSIITEIFYFLRMLLPIIVIYITYKLKFTKEEFIQLFLFVTFAVSSIIVVMNLLNISLTSYGGNHKIQGNIFSWFMEDKPGSKLLASKGWFNSANQISGLFTLLLPISIYAVLEKFNYKRVITLSLCLLAVLMLGTRVSTIGWILIFIVMIVLYFFFSVILKHFKFNKKNFFGTLLIGLIGGILFVFSPLVNTASAVNQAALDAYLKEKEINFENMTVEEYLPFLAIHAEYYEILYPYDEHQDFWSYVAKDVPYYKRGGNRNAQTLITADINKHFATSTSPILGLGYSRFENAKIYMEKDFQIHYYTIGIVGILLFLIPYVIILIYKLYQMLIVDRKLFNFYNITLMAALFLPLAVSLVSGHILDELIVSLYMGFVAGYMLYSIKPNKEL